ncbi:hypothetical protein J19TS2_17680 [Cohnella xylanilytica]|uniref:M23 family metallopeptidase n=2 Tax=Cohnella xylanilytica TaxID=557555 RepID=A0A841TVT0_9BACL|nr:M23 family metallopeptidase [Cohnella xylanilytica]MBB6691729.1 M23 family metallopeptidase [Cohnella xylanilytica]GIO12213.1 hypothetical protein J19TS2_17680 [Cohnella xylanilytica]
MSDQNKTTRKLEEAPKTGAATSPVKPTGMKRFFSKRWVFPAVYMAAAAIIVTILWLNAGAGGSKDPENSVPVSGVESQGAAAETNSPEAVEAAAGGESLQWPFDSKDVIQTLSFYDSSASEEKKQAAMVEYNNSFYPHTALDFAAKDDKPFEVLAAMSGKVKVAEQSPINGYEVEIEHPNGLVTVYQSLEDLKVKAGDEVKQGDVIAMAGRSEMEKDEGVHVHFEVRSNGQSIDPNTLIKEQ